MTKRTFPDALRPVTEQHFHEVKAELFTPTRQELRWGGGPLEIDGHIVHVSHQTDPDGYAGWLDEEKYTGIDYCPATGELFLEAYYFRKNDRLVRFQAKPLHELVATVVVVDGVPSLPEAPTPKTKIHYWHYLFDASTSGFRNPITVWPDYIERYKKLTGSWYLRKFLDLTVQNPSK